MNNKQKKTALLFAYYWPPASGPGVQRWLKFAKYLPENNWDVIVITPENGSYPNTDPTLVNDIPENITIIRTTTIEPFRIFNLISGKASQGNSSSVGMGDIKGSQSFIKKIGAYIRANWFIPDARKGWIRFAKKAGREVLKKQKIEVLVTTGPPHSAHLIGLDLQKQFNIPWIADFRDPWTTIYYNEFLPRSSSSNKTDKNLENQVLREADSIIAVSNGLNREFNSRANGIDVIPNGFDQEDFEDIEFGSTSEMFTLSYIGNFKFNQNCEILWIVISELIESDSEFKTSFKLSITGNIHPDVVDSLAQQGLSNHVEILPFVEHKEAVKRMVSADALLFLIPHAIDNDKIITGKIFEYLASRTPLLSIGPKSGDASKILSECNRSEMIDYNEKSKIKSRLKSLFDEWKKNEGKVISKDNSYLKFSRKNLTKQLTEVFERVSS